MRCGIEEVDQKRDRHAFFPIGHLRWWLALLIDHIAWTKVIRTNLIRMLRANAEHTHIRIRDIDPLAIERSARWFLRWAIRPVDRARGRIIDRNDARASDG